MIVKAVIQARMSSTRLRGKTLMPIEGKPLLKRVLDTTNLHTFISSVAVATSDTQADDPIEAYCHYLGVECIRGDQTNVLARYQRASQKLNDNDHIVRITADNMFCRLDATLQLFESHIRNRSDYSCVEGLSHVVYEFIRVGAFNRITSEKIGLNAYDEEHVTPIFRSKRSEFSTQVVSSIALGLYPELEKKLTVDTPLDLIRIERLIQDLDIDNSGIKFDQIYHWLSLHSDDHF